MARTSQKLPKTIEDWLGALRGIDVAASPDVVRAALALHKPGAGVAIASAAKRIAEQHAHAFCDDLASAFGNLLGEDAGKLDPACRGKLAIATALHDLDHWDDRVFVVGLSVVQLVGAPPDLEDTAAGLRGLCGIAHAHFTRADALDVLAALLADPEILTRTSAAQGIGDAGRRDGTALLRYKLLADSDDPDVLGACFDSLFHLAPEASATFAIELVAADTGKPPCGRTQSAALALGGNRVAAAREPLVAWCARSLPEVRRNVGYIALALLRDDAANAYLLDIVATGARGEALAAAKALATFKETIADSIRVAIDKVTDRALRSELAAVLA